MGEMERLEEERWKTDRMEDEISGGNGFQGYLMTYGGKDKKYGQIDQIEYLERV